MATQGSALATDIAAFSARILDHREVSPRARIVSEAVAELLSGSACTLYLLGSGPEGQTWIPKTTAGDVSIPDSSIPVDEGTLGILSEKAKALVFSAKELTREHYAHLHVRRTLSSLAYLPLIHNDALIGALEILSFDQPLHEDVISSLQPMAGIAASALV